MLLLPLLVLSAELLLGRLPSYHLVDTSRAFHGGALVIPGLGRQFLLQRDDALFHPDYAVYLDGERVEAPQTDCFFRGPDGEHFSACDGHVRGHFHHDGEHWAVQQAHAHDTTFAYRLADVPADMRQGDREGIAAPTAAAARGGPAARRLPAPMARSLTGPTAYLEVVMVSDESQTAQYGTGTEAQAAALFQTVQAMHATKPNATSGVNFVLTLRAQLLVSNHSTQGLVAPPDAADAAMIDSGGYLVNFAAWIETRATALGLTAWDTAVLVSGTEFGEGTLGLAYTAATCVPGSRASVNSVKRGSDFFGASIVAHELGHGWGACHDPPATRADPVCALPAVTDAMACDGFLMAASGDPTAADALVPSQFSPCTDADFNNFLELGSTTCLEAPLPGTPTWNDTAVCGNGIVETGETCDTGAVGNTSCCAGCQLTNGSACHHGDVCCNDQCQFLPSGTLCRASSASCDPVEYCTGASGVCPADVTDCGATTGTGGDDDLSPAAIGLISAGSVAVLGGVLFFMLSGGAATAAGAGGAGVSAAAAGT